MRPRLAGDVVRSLMRVEGLPGDQIVVVVNGVGGLDDPALEREVQMVRLPRNLGPAGGFRAGMEEAFARPSTQWAYLCEDDIGLFSVPAPRVGSVLDRVDDLGPSGKALGAVVAYGRRFVGRGAHTVNVVPSSDEAVDLLPVDVACWGATLVSRSSVRRRGPSRPELVLRAGGLRLLLPGQEGGTGCAARRSGRSGCRRPADVGRA